mmetsp:Transcript_40933/g.68711  ORF Transcript_40933/g.68711 Transcript_40933/m.68711 type:complete len:101 (+) Transcript_40933:950-1252(+)
MQGPNPHVEEAGTASTSADPSPLDKQHTADLPQLGETGAWPGFICKRTCTCTRGTTLEKSRGKALALVPRLSNQRYEERELRKRGARCLAHFKSTRAVPQ